MNSMDLYNKLPFYLQNIACSIEGKRINNKRYNKDFWRYLNDYQERNNYTYEQISEYRNEKIRKMVKHCYTTVPYYTNLFNEREICYEDIRTLEDLKCIPILTKEIVRDNFEDFISTSEKLKNVTWSKTNGTTGSGFQFMTTQQTLSEQWAVWWRYRRNIGIDINLRCAIFGGKMIVPIQQKTSPYWRINSPSNQILFSIFHLNDNSMGDYIDALNKYGIKWIHGYPSAISLIAVYMNEKNIKLNHQVEFVTIGSESLLVHQKKSIYEAFNVQPKQHYGLAEGVANISENLDGELVVDDDFSAVEFIDMEDEGTHIIGSSLNNFVMPLLRYDTKDIVNVDENNDFIDGRKVFSIDGRKEDYIVLKNGNKIGRLASAFADVSNVVEAQIIQTKIGEIKVNLIPNKNYSKKDELIIFENLKKLLGSETEIFINIVNNIVKTKSGKLRFVISDIKENL